MLKKLGIGCGGLLAVIIVIVVIVSASGGGGGNGGGSPSVAETPPQVVNPTQVWNEFAENETRANERYKGKWLQVTLPTISKIESNGRVQMEVDEFGFNHIELDFRNNRDVIDLNPGQSITAVCQLDGFQLDSWLEFDDCRWP